jgi:hypothetical protein
MSENLSPIALKNEGMSLFRSVTRLEALFLTLRQIGLTKVIPGPDAISASERLKQLLEQLR